MKTLRLLAALLAGLMLVPACASPDAASQQPAEAPNRAVPGSLPSSDEAGGSASLGTAPDFTLPTLAGDSLGLADLRGQVVLLNFWATWCGPCLEEIPALVDLYEDLHPAGLAIVGVSLDEEGEEVVAPFAARFNINYPVALDQEGTVAEAFGGVWALPTTYVIDAEGAVVERIIGVYPVEERRPALGAMLDALPRVARRNR